MSNDLISRSALMQSLRNNVLVDVTPNLEQAIEEQPTAYNVDKVVEQLEEMRLKREEQLRACVDNDMADYLRCKMSAIAEAIEIVKSGGIAEEKKAEWKEHFASRFGRIE